MSSDQSPLAERVGAVPPGSSKPMAVVAATFMDFFAVADMARREKRIMPCLALTYTTIDALAWLERPEGKGYSDRNDFTDWVDRRILAVQPLGCTAIDLYAARCAIVHTYSAGSKLADEGKAKSVSYAWGSADAAKLRRVFAESKHAADVVVVQVDDLMQLVRHAYGRLLVELEDHPERRPLIEKRAAKFFTPVPSPAVDALLSRESPGT